MPRRLPPRSDMHKTKMCPFVSPGEICKKRSCSYAHSEKELRSRPNLCMTKLCRAAVQEKVCQDPECRYAHFWHELNENLGDETYYRTQVCEFWVKGCCKNEERCRFAHGESQLRNGSRSSRGGRRVYDDSQGREKSCTVVGDALDTEYRKQCSGSDASTACEKVDTLEPASTRHTQHNKDEVGTNYSTMSGESSLRLSETQAEEHHSISKEYEETKVVGASPNDVEEGGGCEEILRREDTDDLEMRPAGRCNDREASSCSCETLTSSNEVSTLRSDNRLKYSTHFSECVQETEHLLAYAVVDARLMYSNYSTLSGSVGLKHQFLNEHSEQLRARFSTSLKNCIQHMWRLNSNVEYIMPYQFWCYEE